MSALFAAVERRDLALIRLLFDAGATSDEDAFYHACEQSDTALLDALHRPGFENLVNHKLDFEDLTGLRWFLGHGVDVNAHRCLHHAISRGSWRPHPDRLDRRRSQCQLAVGSVDVCLCGSPWLPALGISPRSNCSPAVARPLSLDPVDAAVLAIARGESVRLPKAPAPALGATPAGRWVRLDPRPVRPPWPHGRGAGAA